MQSLLAHWRCSLWLRLNGFTDFGWLAVSQLTGLVLIKSSLPLFRFASAASRVTLVQAANKQRHGDAYRALALGVMFLVKLGSFASNG